MSFDAFVASETLGTKKHLLICKNETIEWVDDFPPDAWVLGSADRPSHCLRTLFRLCCVDVSTSVPKKFEQSMRAVLHDKYDSTHVPWAAVLPTQVYRLFFTGLARNVLQALKVVDTTYYNESFQRVTSLFESLGHAAINVPLLESYLSDPKTVNPQTLKTFQPLGGSFAKKVEYNRFGTRTGRLTTLSGPDMLTLKKSYRNVITSRFQGGKVKYVDFASLEARVLLTCAGQVVETRDIYAEVAQKLNIDKPRNIIKLIVLATVFGSGQEELQRLAKMGARAMSRAQESIREMFGTESLKARLQAEWKANSNKIKNAFGRVLHVPTEDTLVNTFVQSSGVDVALHGFLRLFEQMRFSCPRSVPLFVLHDALVIDVFPSELNSLDEIVLQGVDVPCMKNRFFLDSSDLYT